MKICSGCNKPISDLHGYMEHTNTTTGAVIYTHQNCRLKGVDNMTNLDKIKEFHYNEQVGNGLATEAAAREIIPMATAALQEELSEKETILVCDVLVQASNVISSVIMEKRNNLSYDLNLSADFGLKI